MSGQSLSKLVPRTHRAGRPRWPRGFSRWALFSLAVFVASACAPPAQAIVQVVFDVLPADDPFTLEDEGLPALGNRLVIDPFDPSLNDTAAEQPLFECSPDVDGCDITVGATSYGELLITSNTALRWEDLIIGGMGLINEVPVRGTGVVRVAGSGALYNNAYMILPAGIDFATFGSTRQADDEDGFDLIVGQWGGGTMNVSAGGVVQIQDAVVVGDQSGSTGELVIDGFNSFLGSGGYSGAAGAEGTFHQMVIGNLGNGTMRITNGGQVFAVAPDIGPEDFVIGAVIGSQPYEGSDVPGPSGVGNVYVDGLGSRWVVAGTLQVGGFHDANEPGTGKDIEGNDVIYNASIPPDWLYVQNGGLVNIISPFVDPEGGDLDQLDLAVGFSGRVVLNNGAITLVGVLSPPTGGGNAQQELDRGAVINDGEISGNGTIDVLQFRNRVLGRVFVNPAQKMVISATGQYTEDDNLPAPDEQEYPLSNYGLVRVLGTETNRAEIEFVRAPVSPDLATATNMTRPLLNLPVTGATAPNGRTEGLIHGEYATMRFGTGLWNRGVVAFTRGDNVVSGDVFNCGDVPAPGGGCDPLPGENGTLLLGPSVNVAFEDDLILEAGSSIVIDPTATFQVLAGSSFVNNGTFEVTVTGSTSGMSFNPILLAGNATFGGTLDVTLTNSFSIPPLSEVKIFDVGGSIFGNFDRVLSSSSAVELVTFARNGDLFLQAFVAPAAGSGPDFNGDGVIDLLDLQIWMQNAGGPGPAGDANGDGIVNGRDFFEWQQAVVMPGAGSGGLAGQFGTVPEPTSAVLLACGSLLVLATRRRRAARTA